MTRQIRPSVREALHGHFRSAVVSPQRALDGSYLHSPLGCADGLCWLLSCALRGPFLERRALATAVALGGDLDSMPRFSPSELSTPGNSPP